MSYTLTRETPTVTPTANGTRELTKLNDELKFITLREKVSAADDGTSAQLISRFPAMSKLISAQLRWSTALAVDGTNGTNGTADTVALVKTAPTSLTTDATTETIVQGSTTKTAGQLTAEFRARNAAEWVNETENDLDMYLVPFDPNGAETFDPATNGYLFDGTQDIYVELQFERFKTVKTV